MLNGEAVTPPVVVGTSGKGQIQSLDEDATPPKIGAAASHHPVPAEAPWLNLAFAEVGVTEYHGLAPNNPRILYMDGPALSPTLFGGNQGNRVCGKDFRGWTIKGYRWPTSIAAALPLNVA